MRKRIAIIHRDKCNPQGCGNYLCAKLCPVNRAGEECIKNGDETTNKAIIDEVLCTGCGICPKRCPYGAIEIINLPTELDKEPIHRYGENTFALFSLPTVLFGKVVGVLGKNGIGKSTAFKILAGILKANLGKWDEVVQNKDILAYFKGTEMQGFLEKLFQKKVSLAYKPQQVELVPKTFNGTVKELLLKVNSDIKKIEEIVKELELINFLNTDISKVSGGELQRVVIAATVLKNSNLVLFDEPSSYLDIKQRIKVSKFIRSLTTENYDDLSQEKKAVLVVEHDLIILDYMTDLLNIMYGHEGVYGIVSAVKNTREGINQFLDGKLKEENVRFRNLPLKFQQFAEQIKGPVEELISWSDLTLELGEGKSKFVLESKDKNQKVALNKNEIVGVLGENGTGKSSFVKVLAGVSKVKSGEISGNVDVSYKSQYLDYSEDERLVSEVLREAIAKYSAQIIKPFGIESFLKKKMKQLSGGELQRVVIANCLSKDVDLYLLDEPSAYLDIEQRLIVSRAIKKFVFETEKTVLVVDHDLMFIDNLSDRLMIFTGEPSKKGIIQGPMPRVEGMNLFLKELGITLRCDPSSKRPRINKVGSVKDREQRNKNKWYYD